MRNYSREALLGVSLGAAAALGLTACGGSVAHAEHQTRSGAEQSIDAVAARIMRLYSRAPHQYSGKPPHTEGFSIPTTLGGDISVSVQTSTTAHLASQTESVDLQQSIPHGVSYNLLFLEGRHGAWNTYCSSQGAGISEIGQEEIEFGASKPVKDRAAAQAVLEDDTTNAGRIMSAIAGHLNGPAIRPFSNICRINLG